VCEDAKAEGYIAVMGFPTVRAERYEWDYTGPLRLFEKAGFAIVHEKLGVVKAVKKVVKRDKSVVMRKELV